MKPGLFVRLLVVGMSAFGLNACSEIVPETYRFRLTVEIDTPQGLRTGSSVYEVWANNKTSLLPDEAKRDWGVKGEAVAVELPNGRTLFALLKTNADHNDLAGLSMSALDPAYRNDVVESAKRISNGHGTKRNAVVAPHDYPILATFRNPDDPKSIEIINESSIGRYFGHNYRIIAIKIAITNAKITTGNGNIFPDFGEGTGFSHWRQSLPQSDVRRNISKYDFVRGI